MTIACKKNTSVIFRFNFCRALSFLKLKKLDSILWEKYFLKNSQVSILDSFCGKLTAQRKKESISWAFFFWKNSQVSKFCGGGAFNSILFCVRLTAFKSSRTSIQFCGKKNFEKKHKCHFRFSFVGSFELLVL